MRILMVVSPCESGALAASLIPAIHHLQSRDEVTVCCADGRMPEAFVEHAVFPLILPTRMADPRTLFRLMSLIMSQKIDVVYAHGSHGAFCCAMAARLMHVPYVAMINEIGHAWHGAQHIVATSQALQRQLVAQGIPNEKITIVRNGIALEHYPVIPTIEAKRIAGFSPAIPRAGIFGNITHAQRYVRAWVEVTQRLPKARLLIVGAGRSEATLRVLAQRLHLATHVEFLPAPADQRALMEACDVILDAGGVTLLQAMALARPIIGLQTGDVQEIVDCETGLLVPPDDPCALASALVRALQDHAWRDQHGAAARATRRHPL